MFYLFILIIGKQMVSFASHASLAVAYIRLPYQTSEAIGFTALYAGTSRSINLYCANKIALTAFDAFAHYSHYFNDSSAQPHIRKLLNVGEIGCRLADMFRGLYLLNQNSVNRDYIRSTIVLNGLNIYRLILENLSKIGGASHHNTFHYPALACSILDAAVRIYFLFDHRIAIRDQATQLTQQFNLASVWRSFIQGVDYIGRTIGHTACIAKSFALGTFFFKFINPAISYQQATLAPLFVGLTSIARINVRNILDQMAIPRGFKRDMAEWTIAAVSSATLVTTAAVGWGLVSSISEVFRRVAPSLCLIAMLGTLGLAIHNGLRDILDDLGFQHSTLRDFAQTLIACMSSYFLTNGVMAGCGLIQSQAQLNDLYIHTLESACGLAMIYIGFSHIGSLLGNGPMSWTEIAENLLRNI